MLKLKPSCEHCEKALLANSNEAMICSFECTFCHDCVKNVLKDVCPNCGGNFVPRPIRPKTEHVEGVSLKQYPASGEKVYKPVDANKHLDFVQAVKSLSSKR